MCIPPRYAPSCTLHPGTHPDAHLTQVRTQMHTPHRYAASCTPHPGMQPVCMPYRQWSVCVPYRQCRVRVPYRQRTVCVYASGGIQGGAGGGITAPTIPEGRKWFTQAAREAVHFATKVHQIMYFELRVGTLQAWRGAMKIPAQGFTVFLEGVLAGGECMRVSSV